MQKGQWYFQRYAEQLPNPGEIVFFDRSWYNRAVVEPVMNFCTDQQYRTFMQQVPEFEHMLYEDSLELVKFWFSISKDVQEDRFVSRRVNPLKQWKISPVDDKAQENWDLYTKYKEDIFIHNHACVWGSWYCLDNPDDWGECNEEGCRGGERSPLCGSVE